jgi:hypothetical protein
MRPSKEVLEYFVQSANGNLNLHKSWIATLEKLLQKAKEISKQTADPDANKEFYYLWAKMYERAFDNLFENIPIARSFEKFLEPVKNTAKIIRRYIYHHIQDVVEIISLFHKRGF